jgi:hypothetical protein
MIIEGSTPRLIAENYVPCLHWWPFTVCPCTKETEKKRNRKTENHFTWTLYQLSHIQLDHALWLMAPSFSHGILSLEVDKRLGCSDTLPRVMWAL